MVGMALVEGRDKDGELTARTTNKLAVQDKLDFTRS